jgi:osmotically-inducible protein OsmY
MRVVVVCVVGFLGACATAPSVRSSPSAVDAYQSVRAGETAKAHSGDLAFCAGPSAVVAERTKARSSDNWTNQFRDRDVADSVRGSLRSDPALVGSAIEVNVHQGAVKLDGHAQNPEVATHAIARALAVDGVVLVQARLFTPEQTSAPAAGHAQWCG